MDEDSSEARGGVIVSLLPNGMLKVQLDNGETVQTHVSGKIRKNFIRLKVGDRVFVERAFHDNERWRIKSVQAQ